MNPSAENLKVIAAFFGGVLMSLTPCVYPLIPVTLGFIGVQAGVSRLKGFLLSFVYVTGVALTYSLLGVAASLTGKLFGSISEHPLTLVAMGVVVILFGVSMAELFATRSFSFFSANNLKIRGFGGALLLGIVSALLVSPCLTPALGSILAYLATKKNIAHGTALLIAFSYGMGLILILAGSFANILVHLPKSGKWMFYLKRLAGIILICAGAYFIYSGIRRI
jgi:thiol:disulfide interchange protein DsbD